MTDSENEQETKFTLQEKCAFLLDILLCSYFHYEHSYFHCTKNEVFH